MLLLADSNLMRCTLRAVLSRSEKLTTFRVLGRAFVSRPPSFLSQYRNIFLERAYDFDAGRPDPAILDLGANVGLSCAFFKHLYPAARIIAFEADPELAAILRGNLERLGHSDIEIIERAAWIEDTTLRFLPNGLDGGRVADDEDTIDVPAIDLNTWLAGRRFDLVKMDIEGAERLLLPHVMAALDGTPRIVFEYHSDRSAEQNLGDILAMLSARGYRYHAQSEGTVLAPFVDQLRGHFDNRLVIYAHLSRELGNGDTPEP